MFPHMDSNIHSKICYNVVYGQVIRYYNICNQKENFIKRVNHLVNIVMTKNYNKRQIIKYILKAIKKLNLFNNKKYDLSLNDITDMIKPVY